MEDAAEPLPSPYLGVGGLPRIGDRRGPRVQRSGVADAPMRPVGAVELFELPQSLEEMATVPDQVAVQKFTPAGLYPPLQDAGSFILGV